MTTLTSLPNQLVKGLFRMDGDGEVWEGWVWGEPLGPSVAHTHTCTDLIHHSEANPGWVIFVCDDHTCQLI